MSRRQRIRSVEELVDEAWKIAGLCVTLADFWPEVERLAAMVDGPDGYGNGSGERGGPGTVADPTANAASRVMEPDAVGVDRIATLIEHMRVEVDAMAQSARRVAGIQRLIEHRGDARYGRQSSLQGDCLACEKSVSGVGEDRLKAGYDPTCHRAWLRYAVTEMAEGHTPNHEVFRRRRRRELARAS